MGIWQLHARPISSPRKRIGDHMTTVSTPNTRLLTPAQAAEFLRRSPKTLANWRSQGYGPEYIDDGRIGYELETLVEWQNSHRACSTAQARHNRRKHASTAFQLDHNWVSFRVRMQQSLAVIQQAAIAA